MEKMVRFGFSVNSSFIRGREGLISIFILFKIGIFDKWNEKSNSMMENVVGFVFSANSSFVRWGGSIIFLFRSAV